MNESILLKRTRHPFQTTQGVVTRDQGKPLINFARNDYLGLSQHPKVQQAAVDAIRDYGTSSSASPLITGYNDCAQKLEDTLAEQLSMEKVLLFSSGTAANYALMHHLSQLHQPIIADKLIHASLIDGILAHSKQFDRFAHNSIHSAEKIIRKNEEPNKKTKKGIMGTKNTKNHPIRNFYQHIVTESVFSMDGDSAPLPTLATLANQHQCSLSVDESHALGALGQDGAGLCQASNTKPYAITSSMGKALASQGGFIAASAKTIEQLTQSARPLIYSTALAPSAIAAAQAALNIMKSTPSYQTKLHENIEYFQDFAQQYDLDVLPSQSAIQGLIIPDIALLMQAHQALWDQGFITGLIRPPTVPQKTSRLRICLSALHTPKQINSLIHTLQKILTQLQRSS